MKRTKTYKNHTIVQELEANTIKISRFGGRGNLVNSNTKTYESNEVAEVRFSMDCI